MGACVVNEAIVSHVEIKASEKVGRNEKDIETEGRISRGSTCSSLSSENEEVKSEKIVGPILKKLKERKSIKLQRLPN